MTTWPELVAAATAQIGAGDVRHIARECAGTAELVAARPTGMQRARFEQLVAEKKKQDAARAHMQSFVDRFRAKASKARQAQSRIKALERMRPIAAIVEDSVTGFNFPTPEALSPPIIRLEDVSVGYDGKPILRGLDLRIDQDDRIALLQCGTAGAEDVVGEADDTVGCAYDIKVVRLFVEPGPGELGAALEPLDDPADLVVVQAAGGGHHDLVRAVPVRVVVPHVLAGHAADGVRGAADRAGQRVGAEQDLGQTALGRISYGGGDIYIAGQSTLSHYRYAHGRVRLDRSWGPVTYGFRTRWRRPLSSLDFSP